MNRNSVSYIVLLGALSALPPLSVDMGLPALPGLQHNFSIPAALAAQTLSLFLLGFALGPIVIGPLSDRYGRRPIMLSGLALFSAAGIGCALAPSIAPLLALRFVQGVAAGSAAVLPAAIVRDLFSGPEGRKRQSYVAMVNSTGPLVAPLLGAVVILASGNWRAIYMLLGLAGMLLFIVCLRGFAETLPPARRAAHLTALAAGYATVLRDKRFLTSSSLLMLSFGGMFAYISSSPLVFMNNLGLSSSAFGLLFAATAAGTISGSSVNSHLLGRGVRPTRLQGFGVVTSAAAALGLVVLARSGHATFVSLAALVILSNFCAGIVMPNATHTALEGLASVAGTGAALLRSMQMLGGSAASALVAVFYDGRSANAMALVMAICAFAAAGSFLWELRSGRALPELL